MDYNLPTEQQSLLRVAMSCTYARQIDKICKATYLGNTCNLDCKYNILRYTDADPRKAELFMLGAERQAHALHDAYIGAEKWHKQISAVFVVVVSLVVGVFLLSASLAIKDNIEHAAKNRPQSKPQQGLFNAESVENKVDKALSKVASNYQDVNGDGLLNCIDAAVLFYKYYPDKNSVLIELNYNTNTGMNHLFNVVNFNGTWRAIEPQAKVKKLTSYFMKDVWGSQYDYTYNRDATKDYLYYVR